MILGVVLRQSRSGPAHPVTQLTGVLHVQVDFHMAAHALLVRGYLSTVRTQERSVRTSLDHRIQQFEEF